jgi:hypothetical protein
MNESLIDIARRGWSLYDRLFNIGPDNKLIEEIEVPRIDRSKYKDAVESWLINSQYIDIRAPVGFLPWNLLCTKKPITGEDIPFLVKKQRLQLLSNGVSFDFHMDSDPPLVAGIDDLAPDLKDGKDLHEDPNHPFRSWPGYKKVTNPNELFLNINNADILYHYGHVTSTDDSKPCKLCLNGTHISTLEVADLLKEEVKVDFERQKIAFFNGCETALSPYNIPSFPKILIEHTSDIFRFIVTIAKIPAWGGAKYAQLLFHSFIQGKTLGYSVERAREDMVTEHNNPIGIFYMVYGKLSTRRNLENIVKDIPIPSFSRT